MADSSDGGKRVTPSSRTNAPGNSRMRKGQRPVSSEVETQSGWRRAKDAGTAKSVGESTPNPDHTMGVAAVGAARHPYGWGALVLAFLGAQLASSIAYMIVQSSSHYDFNVPAGLGSAVGQAAGQSSASLPLSISIPPPLWVTALMQIPLWMGLGLIPIWFAVKKGKGVVADLGLRMKAIDIPLGLAIGVASQLLLVPIIYWALTPLIGSNDVSAAARQLTDRATDPLSIVLVFLIVGIGAPIAEEIYFRGMAQRIFGRKLNPALAIFAAAAFFAVTHLQPLQFPALLAFGVILGLLAWRSGRLGPAIWAHVSFNVVAAAGLLFGFGPQ